MQQERQIDAKVERDLRMRMPQEASGSVLPKSSRGGGGFNRGSREERARARGILSRGLG
jgi:hypothetical protein